MVVRQRGRPCLFRKHSVGANHIGKRFKNRIRRSWRDMFTKPKPEYSKGNESWHRPPTTTKSEPSFDARPLICSHSRFTSYAGLIRNTPHRNDVRMPPAPLSARSAITLFHHCRKPNSSLRAYSLCQVQDGRRLGAACIWQPLLWPRSEVVSRRPLRPGFYHDVLNDRCVFVHGTDAQTNS
jgi:hypothetical protein